MSQQLFSFEGRFITLAQIHRIKAEREAVANATEEVKTGEKVVTTPAAKSAAKPVAKTVVKAKSTAKAKGAAKGKKDTKKVEKVVETKVEESPAAPAVEEAK